VKYSLRDAATESDIKIMASMSILTLLETIPEVRVDPTTVPNFSHEAMTKMYLDSLSNPKHRYIVLATEAGELVGHTIFLLREDSQNVRFGYLYTRYILPQHRGHGFGGRMLDLALTWFKEEKAIYAEAHTHQTNTVLANLFASRGFEATPEEGRWPTLRLRTEFGANGQDLP
jgi:GNAT superfamily N-acetyltransferase